MKKKAQGVWFKQPVRGFHIGGCVAGGPLPEGQAAHAHLRGSFPRKYEGFICAESRSALVSNILEELTHLVVSAGHNDRWRHEMHRIGAKIPAHYKKNLGGKLSGCQDEYSLN